MSAENIAGSISIYMYWLYIICSSFLTCAGNMCIKESRLNGQGFLSFFFMLGLFFFSLNFIVFSRALDQIPISVAYPVFAGLSFILIALASSIIFQETLNVRQWVGMGIVLIGLGCMAN